MSQIASEVGKERLIEEFQTVVTETEQLLKSIATAGSDKAGAVRASVAQSLAAAGERVEKIRAEALRQASVAARATDDYVRGNPWRAVGTVAAVAAIAGLIAGLLIRRS